MRAPAWLARLAARLARPRRRFSAGRASVERTVRLPAVEARRRGRP